MDLFSRWIHNRRFNQFECFERLKEFYEDEPDNKAVQNTLMEEMQQYGPPPIEIIQAIAPDVELDADGHPNFDSPDCRMM